MAGGQKLARVNFCAPTSGREQTAGAASFSGPFVWLVANSAVKAAQLSAFLCSAGQPERECNFSCELARLRPQSEAAAEPKLNSQRAALSPRSALSPCSASYRAANCCRPS